MKITLIFFAVLLLSTLAQEDFLSQQEVDQSNATCKVCCSALKDRPSMNYTFYINTGHFIGGSGEWAIDVYGYSGNNTGYLNPEATCEKNLGPLPATVYNLTYCKDTMLTTLIKPCSFYLNPLDESQMCGRDSFFIHGCDCCTLGDYVIPPTPGCSIGCIVINFQSRLKLRLGDYIHVIKYETLDSNKTKSVIL